MALCKCGCGRETKLGRLARGCSRRGKKMPPLVIARLRAEFGNRKYKPICCVSCGKEFVPDSSRRRACSQECSRIQARKVYKSWKTTESGRVSLAFSKAQKRKREASDPNIVRNYRFRSIHGITLNEWRSMFGKQEGRCAICADTLELGRSTHVDHCHTTGKIRGLLCNHCNVAIGMLREDPGIMMAAARYVERHRAIRLEA